MLENIVVVVAVVVLATFTTLLYRSRVLDRCRDMLGVRIRPGDTVVTMTGVKTVRKITTSSPTTIGPAVYCRSEGQGGDRDGIPEVPRTCLVVTQAREVTPSEPVVGDLVFYITDHPFLPEHSTGLGKVTGKSVVPPIP